MIESILSDIQFILGSGNIHVYENERAVSDVYEEIIDEDDTNNGGRCYCKHVGLYSTRGFWSH